MARQSSQAMLMRNKLGTLILQKAPQEEIDNQRAALAAVTLEPQIQAALNHGLTASKIRRMAERLAAK